MPKIGQSPLDKVSSPANSSAFSLENTVIVSVMSCTENVIQTSSHISVETKLLLEDDLIVQARIDVLVQLFELSNSEDVSAMILNVFETYRKLLIRETPIQNKLSCTTITKLLKSNMIIWCHRKQYDHLYSMVSALMSHKICLLIVCAF